MGTNIETKPNKTSSRVFCYDILRIILVVLVIIGHASYYNITTYFGGIKYSTLMNSANISDTIIHKMTLLLSNWIYTFHMPVFIALSGSVNALNKNRGISTPDFIKKKSLRLLVPFLLIWICWNIPIKYISGYYDGIPIPKILLQIVFPKAVYLWYLEALFFISIICFLLGKLSKKAEFIIVILLWGVGIIVFKKYTMYHILGDPLYYLIWYYLGENIDTLIAGVKRIKMWNAFGMLFFLGVDFILFILQGFFTNKHVAIQYISEVSNVFLLPFLMFIILNWVARSVRVSEKMKNAIVKTSAFSFGLYLYSDPLNYLIMFIAYSIFGINAFGTESFAMFIYILRIIIPSVISIAIVKVLMKMHLKLLY